MLEEPELPWMKKIVFFESAFFSKYESRNPSISIDLFCKLFDFLGTRNRDNRLKFHIIGFNVRKEYKGLKYFLLPKGLFALISFHNFKL